MELGAQAGSKRRRIAPELLRGQKAVSGFGVGYAFEKQLGVAHGLPLLDQRGVDSLEHCPQEGDDVVDRLSLDLIGDVLIEGFVDLGEVAEEHALGALESIAANVVGEAQIVLDHLPRHRFGPDGVAAYPRVIDTEALEGGENVIGDRLRVGYLVEAVHSLVV